MANLSKVDPSCLPEKLRKRLCLIEAIRKVCEEIEFRDDHYDRLILARELDRRKISPVEASRWYRPESKNPGALLTRFLERHLPQLLHKRQRSKAGKL